MGLLKEYLEITNDYGIEASEILNIYKNQQEYPIKDKKLVKLSGLFLVFDKYVKDKNFNYLMKNRAYFVAGYGNQDCVISNKGYQAKLKSEIEEYEITLEVKKENEEEIEISNIIKSKKEVTMDRFVKKPGKYTITHTSSGFSYEKSYNDEGIQLYSLLSYNNGCGQNISEYYARIEDNKVIKILGNGDSKKYFIGKELFSNKEIVPDNIDFKRLKNEEQTLIKPKKYN